MSRVLSAIEELEKDTKHVKPLSEPDEEEVEQRQKAREILARLKDVSSPNSRGRSWKAYPIFATGSRRPSGSCARRGAVAFGHALARLLCG